LHRFEADISVMTLVAFPATKSGLTTKANLFFSHKRTQRNTKEAAISHKAAKT
jgi:hypothetical protein